MSGDCCGSNNKRKAGLRIGPSRWTLKRKAIDLADEELEEIFNSQPDSVLATETTNIPHRPLNSETEVIPDMTQTSASRFQMEKDPFSADNYNSIYDPKLSYPVSSESITPSFPNGEVENLLNGDISEECFEDQFSITNEGDQEVYEAQPSVYLPLLSVAFYLRDGLTKTAIDHHLSILNIATEAKFRQLRSPYLLLSKYQHLKADIKKTFVCKHQKCPKILTLTNDGIPIEKQPCGHRQDAHSSGFCYVLNLPIEKQLAFFIEHHGLSSEWDVNEEVRSDLNSGSAYRELRESGLIDKNTITLQINTDGAQCFQVSKFGFWPVMGIINEAPYKIRRNYVILLALWYGNKKPPREALFDGTIAELNRLQADGFLVGEKKYNVRVVVITTDTVARPLVYNVTQFNGQFGCNFCLAPGERVSRNEKGSVQVYPELRNDSSMHQLRTLGQHVEDVEKAMRTNKRVNGIIGPTPLHKLINFDYIRGCVPEYMHSCCQGVIKQLITLWFSKSNSKKPWYIGGKILIVNRRLAKIRPPSEVTRTLGAIDDIANWKASMFRSFALYFFQVLEGLLKDEYFEHFTNFVYGFYGLLQERISVTDVHKIEKLFKKFVIDMEDLYGVQTIGINIHFLTHLPKAVLDWGCLWATSTFIPEWFNGQLLSLCNGSQAVAEQMAQNYLLRHAVRDEVVGFLKSDIDIPPTISNLLIEWLHLPTDTRKELIEDVYLVNEGQIKLLGNAKERDLTQEEENSLRELFRAEDLSVSMDEPISRCRFYERLEMQRSSSLFTTSSYTRSPKRSNCFVLMNDGVFFLVESIILIDSVPPIGRSFIIGREIGVISKHMYLPKPIDDIFFSHFPGQTAKLEGLGTTLKSYDPKNILSKCVVAMQNTLTSTYVVTALVNNFESD